MCPYKWYLQYKLHWKTLPNVDPANALWLGLALHKGIEEWSVEAGVAEYKSHYPIITDTNWNWIMQLEYQLPKVFEILPQGGQHELEIKTQDFVGYVDYVVGDTLVDFKFSNNIDNYRNSPQLSIYKYYLELTHPEIKINHLKFLFVPKVNIRQKKTETLFEFRERLQENLEATEIKLIEVPYSETSVSEFQADCQEIAKTTDFPKNETRLCGWCDFEPYCKRGEDWMIIK